MTSPIENVRSPWISFLAHLFMILVAWTLFIKYLFPIGFALANNEAWGHLCLLGPVAGCAPLAGLGFVGEAVVYAQAGHWHVGG